MGRTIEIGQVWRHYMGWEYFVEGISIADQNYKNEKGQSFFRSKESFLGVKSSDEGTNFYRFEQVS